MGWEDILKKKWTYHKGSKIRLWYRYVDEIMSDGQIRSSRDIYNKLVDYMRSPHPSGYRRTGRNIPHISHLTAYLTGSPKFAKVNPDASKNFLWEWVGEEE
jgi:hypothetical protein